jgi:hypothetical protein
VPAAAWLSHRVGCSGPLLQLGTYHHHQAVKRDPSKASLRAQRDTELSPKIKTCWEASGKRYGAVKAWYDLVEEGEDVARCTVVRLIVDCH